MKRFKDWRARLSNLIEERRREPLKYGTHDCALFVADCIKAMTNVDLAIEYRDKYESLEDGLAALRRDGFNDLCEFVSLALKEVHPSTAVNGDIMAFNTPDGWALGICNGERVTVLRPDGLGTVSRDIAERAFKV